MQNSPFNRPSDELSHKSRIRVATPCDSSYLWKNTNCRKSRNSSATPPASAGYQNHCDSCDSSRRLSLSKPQPTRSLSLSKAKPAA